MPGTMADMLKAVKAVLPASSLAVHCHDKLWANTGQHTNGLSGELVYFS